MKKLKNKREALNIAAAALAAVLVAVVIWGCVHRAGPANVDVSDGIEQVDLDTIYLQYSGVEVDFSDVLLTGHNELRKLIVSSQSGTVSTELTDRLIKQLDFDFLKKTQSVSYTGTGYFVVDLDNLTAANVVQDAEKKTVTIKIGHAYLQAIDIDPNKVMIGDVKESLLARGDVELSIGDYTAIERELRTRLEDKLNTAANGQQADELALSMVREVYEPVVKAIDGRYSVIVEFK